ncbi:bladder cancer-related protein BC10-domain-containing protein [Xylaria grammica]|nr:bladder cancer-related protein BC10-domain-containing protein [Xylaria grammica]
MFCLRSWIPLLFIPANASPGFIFLFFVCTYFLNRPCVYCSILLLILFVTSCYWSDRCFFEFSSNWFAPRVASAAFESWVGIESRYPANVTTSPAMMAALDPVAHNVFNSTTIETLNTTVSALSSIVAYTTSLESWIESNGPANATTTAAMTAAAAADPAFYTFFNSTTMETLNINVTALARIASESLAQRKKTEWTGLGIEWLRSLLGKREWRIECMDVNIRL